MRLGTAPNGRPFFANAFGFNRPVVFHPSPSLVGDGKAGSQPAFVLLIVPMLAGPPAPLWTTHLHIGVAEFPIGVDDALAPDAARAS